MGPKHGRDQDGQGLDAVSLEPLELGSHTENEEALEISVVGSQHWWGELVRADVLAVASAAAVIVSVLGLPFAQFLANFFLVPMQISTAWMFLPVVVATAVATALGLGAVRQAFRHDAAAWVRVVGGAATLVGFLLLVGTAVTWLYVVDSGLMDELRGFF